MDYHALMAEFRRSAILAGARILKVYHAEDFEVRAKDDASPVTEADEAADALISERLRAAFPDVPLVTEEQAARVTRILDEELAAARADRRDRRGLAARSELAVAENGGVAH